MAAAINILFRGKYGWGFPVGSFRPCFFVFNGGFYQTTPGPVQYPLDYKCGLGLVGYTGTALTTQLVLTPVQHPRMGLKTPATCDGPLTKNGCHQHRKTR